MTTKVTNLNIDTSTITTIGTLTSLSVTGNVTSGNATLGNLVTGNYFSGNGSLLTSLAGANVSGQVSNALIASTVYTAAQPNITSTGTLTSLTVSGVSTFGDVGNVKITGGSSGQYISTDGSGNLTFVTVTVPASAPHPFLFLGI